MTAQFVPFENRIIIIIIKKKDQVMSGLVLVAEKDLNIWQSCTKRVDKRF